MEDVVGRPGTWSSLVLRVSQFLCAVATIVTMATAYGITDYSAFFYLSFSMIVQLFWSLCFACLDIIFLTAKADLNDHPSCVCAILVGDWCVALLSSTAVTASAGVIIFFKRDVEFCIPPLICDQYELSVILAFMAWSFEAASAASLFWFRASL